MVKNPPCNAGDVGSIPDQGTKIPHAVKQLSPRATITEPRCLSPCATTRGRVCVPQGKIAHDTTKTQSSQKKFLRCISRENFQMTPNSCIFSYTEKH